MENLRKPKKNKKHTIENYISKPHRSYLQYRRYYEYEEPPVIE